MTSAQVARIAQIANSMYEYDPGSPLLSAPVEDEKYLIKLDWNINDSHRANLTYNYNDGFNTVRSDGDDDEYEFSNHFYNRGADARCLFGDVVLRLERQLLHRSSGELRETG